MSVEAKEPALFFVCQCGEKVSLNVPYAALSGRLVRVCDNCGARYEVINGNEAQLGLKLERQSGRRQ